MESIQYRIKLKKGNFVFEVEGDKDFVEDYIMKAEDYMELMNSYEDFKSDNNKIHNIKTVEYNPELREGTNIPLDAYLNQFNLEAPQRMIVGVALYWLDEEERTSFKPSDINIILKENHMKPIKSISTHINRLRNKGLISYVREEGKNNIYTIYKDQINSARDFIKKVSE